MLSRFVSLLLILTLPALSLTTTGCMKKKPKVQTRVSRPLTADASGIPSGVAPGDFSLDGSAPGVNGFDDPNSMAFGEDGAFGAENGTFDETGSLENTASLDGVEEGAFVSELEMIHFEFDSDTISSDWAAILDGHISWLASNPSIMVQIEGHCDDRGTEEYNTSLGQRRADAVRTYMAERGIDANRLSTISYGEMRPMSFDQSEEAHALNRRAMFLVYEVDNSLAAADSF